MKRLLFIVYLSVVVVAAADALVYTFPRRIEYGKYGPQQGSCGFVVNYGCEDHWVELWGKVKVVDGPADVQVYLDSKCEYGAELVVKWVKGQPACCGEWQRVTSGEDFTVTFVDDWMSADLIIQYGEPQQYYKYTDPF
ncbi:MAG: hypothetical protein IJT12_00480 [Paludibacteraceae bacterium]|nr:hypothetical protein [Paludibacteraceae bacterium]